MPASGRVTVLRPFGTQRRNAVPARNSGRRIYLSQLEFFDFACLALATEIPYKGTTSLGRVIEEQVAIIVSDISKEQWTMPELNARMNPAGLQAAYVAPVSTSREKLGVLLAGVSALVASRLASRIGLVKTMVYTHLPSNVLLILVPLMPTLTLAVAVLLLRFSISQMDVPLPDSRIRWPS